MNKIKTNSKALMAFTVIILMMTAIIGGTFAAYSSTASVGGSATVGSIDITAEFDDTTASGTLTGGGTYTVNKTTVTITNILPGETVTVKVNIANTGRNKANITLAAITPHDDFKITNTTTDALGVLGAAGTDTATDIYTFTITMTDVEGIDIVDKATTYSFNFAYTASQVVTV